ncbi:putative GTPase activating protein for Arf-domain-containing protein [Globomyces pollinis-pini]|nr:putative GTPase activating protein for Arf-domain-containing protein [Globomyces pollinis-pini]
MDLKEQKKKDEKQLKLIQELLNRPENQKCVDCSTRGPRWASVNIGCFLCIRCAGIHRKMGTHISKIKSTNLDSWNSEWFEIMSTMGNEKVNRKYLSKGNVSHINEQNDADMEVFIRNKYERGLYSNDSIQKEHQSNVRKAYNASSDVFDERQMSTLISMGFNDRELNITALARSNGNIDNAIDFLISQKPTSKKPDSMVNQNQTVMRNLGKESRVESRTQNGDSGYSYNQASKGVFDYPKQMPVTIDPKQLRHREQMYVVAPPLPTLQNKFEQLGFKNQEANESALRQANGDFERAVNILMDSALAQPRTSSTRRKKSVAYQVGSPVNVSGVFESIADAVPKYTQQVPLSQKTIPDSNNFDRNMLPKQQFQDQRMFQQQQIQEQLRQQHMQDQMKQQQIQEQLRQQQMQEQLKQQQDQQRQKNVQEQLKQQQIQEQFLKQQQATEQFRQQQLQDQLQYQRMQGQLKQQQMQEQQILQQQQMQQLQNSVFFNTDSINMVDYQQPSQSLSINPFQMQSNHSLKPQVPTQNLLQQTNIPVQQTSYQLPADLQQLTFQPLSQQKNEHITVEQNSTNKQKESILSMYKVAQPAQHQGLAYVQQNAMHNIQQGMQNLQFGNPMAQPQPQPNLYGGQAYNAVPQVQNNMYQGYQANVPRTARDLDQAKSASTVIDMTGDIFKQPAPQTPGTQFNQKRQIENNLFGDLGGFGR